MNTKIRHNAEKYLLKNLHVLKKDIYDFEEELYTFRKKELQKINYIGFDTFVIALSDTFATF